MPILQVQAWPGRDGEKMGLGDWERGRKGDLRNIRGIADKSRAATLLKF